MRMFMCGRCGQVLHFENTHCLGCGAPVGFLPDVLLLSSCEPQPDGTTLPADTPDVPHRVCGNAGAACCNWLVRADSGETFCDACRLNRTIPDLTIIGNDAKWRDIEAAKRRLVYALKRLSLPLGEGGTGALAFDFLADAPGQPVMTGHEDGLVTINIAEADTAERERRRQELGEPYRTLLGHMRHEVGHYVAEALVLSGPRAEEARAVFGDERQDYEAALRRHYEQGPPPDWQAGYVSAYATMHPAEDFAETWAHYLHMVETLDTAASFGLALRPEVQSAGGPIRVSFDPYRAMPFEALVQAWVPMTVAVNALNRSMGQPDLYPFAPSPAAIDKLRFIHTIVHGPAEGASGGAGPEAIAAQ